MGLLDTIKGLFVISDETRANINSPNVPLTPANISTAFSGVGSAGVAVTKDSALSLSEIWRALKVLGETLASVPIQVYEKQANGSKKFLPDHPVSLILTIEPNVQCTPFTFIETMVMHAALMGNAYASIEYNRRNAYPKALHILDPQNVDVFVGNGRLFYKDLVSGKTYDHDEIIHIQNTSWNGMAGLNILVVHRDNISLALANRNYGANFYKNGARLGGILEHPGSLSKEASQRLRESWAIMYEGSDKAGKTAVLEEGMKYTALGLKPSDASFSETKRLVVADMARIFGVPQFILEDLDRATFNNIEHLSWLFLSNTIRPWCRRIEAEFNRKLFPKAERGRVVAFFDFDDLLMADLKSRAEYLRTLFNMGAISPNEARKSAGYNPFGDGDGHYLQNNMIDLTKLGDAAMPGTPAVMAAPVEPEKENDDEPAT